MENIHNSIIKIKSRLKLLKVQEFSDRKSSEIPKAAVFVLLTQKHDGPSILFVKRSNEVSNHKGEICFPGGKKEIFDKSLLDTAYRELEEEIGVTKQSIEIICSLSPEITRTGYIIFPYVAHLIDDSNIKPDKSEIEKVMFITLDDIQDPERKRTIDFLSKKSRIQRKGFLVNNYLVWGATSNITNELLERIHQ